MDAWCKKKRSVRGYICNQYSRTLRLISSASPTATIPTNVAAEPINMQIAQFCLDSRGGRGDSGDGVYWFDVKRTCGGCGWVAREACVMAVVNLFMAVGVNV